MMLTEVMVSGMLEEKQSLRKLLASYGLHAGSSAHGEKR